MIVNLKYCVIGESFELVEDVHVEIIDEIITHIGKGKLSGKEVLEYKSGIAIPTLINSHIHIFDYAFMETGLDLGLGKLVKEPNGLKHRLLRESPIKKLEKAASKVALLQLSQGVLTMASFCELGYRGLMIAKSATSKLPLRNILLGRPEGSLEEKELDRVLAISDGFGLSSPLVYDTESLELIRRKAGKKIVATHVSETRSTHNHGDFELAIKYLKPDIIVHGVYLSQEQILEMVERNISLVACPRSNMWFSAGSPPLAEALDSEANVALGTDNAGWINPDLWREMEFAWNLIRLRGKLDVKAKDILKMVTTNAAKALEMDKFGIICEGYEASFIVLNASYLNLDFAHDKLAAIVKRGCREAILAIFFKGQCVDWGT